MGINVNATISMTFAIGSALAAIAGVLLCSAYPTLMPTTGSMPGIKAFTAAVFGGIGSIPGAMLGGIAAGHHRDLCQGLHLHTAGRRHRLCRADRGAAGQALPACWASTSARKCEVDRYENTERICSKHLPDRLSPTYGVVIAAFVDPAGSECRRRL